ncbi:hypothetical protein SAMN06295920_10161 [Rhizorhabdus histidinilytica]|jgi:hypothetical protein|uniref:Uncharacterized protein n=1 Tax=Rhizorhabdus histidinilytica TaxID=439228 RepID=A0A1T4ZQT5_9SPHN|nr:hypothetical protein SAMN06295920_10161 [Rhizorhabdus histidinilytica]
MHEIIRAPRQLRARTAQLTYEAWHDLSRYVVACKAASERRTVPPGGGSDDRNG